MKTFTVMTLTIACLLLGCLAAYGIEIYIHNKPLQGETIVKGDEVYVPAASLKKLVRGDLSWDEKTGVISVNGKDTSLRLLMSNNTPFVPLKATAKEMGYDVSYNKSTGIMDIFKSKPYVPEPKPTATTGPGQPSPSPSAGPDKGSDLLVITEKGAAPNVPPEDPSSGRNVGELRIYADVTNGRPTEARNVIATCILKTQDGNVFNQTDVSVGNLQPGEKKEVLFFFPNDGGGIILKRSFTVKGN